MFPPFKKNSHVPPFIALSSLSVQFFALIRSVLSENAIALWLALLSGVLCYFHHFVSHAVQTSVQTLKVYKGSCYIVKHRIMTQHLLLKHKNQP